MGRRADCKLDRAQYLVLIWQLAFLGIAHALLPSRGQAVESQSLAFQNRRLLAKEQRILIEQLRHCQAILYRLPGYTSEGAQISQAVINTFFATLGQFVA